MKAKNNPIIISDEMVDLNLIRMLPNVIAFTRKSISNVHLEIWYIAWWGWNNTSFCKIEQ